MAQGRPRNLLILMSDEHQARAMGCAGHPFVSTPHLDALADRGTRFAQAYTPSPICVPARASFATGLYAHETRMWDNAMPYDGSITGWGHSLQSVGVRSESIGKLHYRAAEDPAGFDAEHIPMMVKDGVGMVWASVRAEDERKTGTGRMLGDYIGPGTSPYTDYDASVTARTCDWLTDNADTGPWCLYVGLVAPHFPLVCPPEFYDLYKDTDFGAAKLHPADGHARHPWVEKQNAFMDSEAKFRDADERRAAVIAYYGLVSWLDHNVGQILRALNASGAGEDTTIIYTSDHGDNVGARGLWGKSNMYEESVAVPLIMAGPDVPEGVCNTPVSLLDLAPTITSHFGAPPVGTEGIAPLPDLIEHRDPDRPIFSEYHAAGAVSGAFMLRRGRWKLIHYKGFPDELFDLETDPEETRNLAEDPSHDAIRADLRATMEAICDTAAADRQAFADQAAMIAAYGGKEAAFNLGAPGATPPPEAAQ